MVFVNEIADIAHTLVDQMTGAANKNIGEAFLFVWRFPTELTTTDPNGGITLTGSPKIRQYADLAIIAFVKIVGSIRLSYKL